MYKRQIMQFVVEPPIGALNTAINNGLNGLNGASAVVPVSYTHLDVYKRQAKW